jgi:hypothetical protein
VIAGSDGSTWAICCKVFICSSEGSSGENKRRQVNTDEEL